MFLSTLGWHADGVIKSHISWVRKSMAVGSSSARADNRGKHTCKPKHAMDHEPIRAHILSYNPTISHYTRNHAPNRRYLEPELSITGTPHNNSYNYSKGITHV